MVYIARIFFKITVVQLVLTIPNPVDFVKNYDKIGI